MGLLSKMDLPGRPAQAAPDSDLVYREPAPVLKEVPAPKRDTTLTAKRNALGLIESVSGFNADGEKVTFEFERNGKKTLERINVKKKD